MKILIIRLSSIGDVVLATPLARCLRKKYPDAQIDFLTKPAYAEILSGNPYVSNIVEYHSFFNALEKIKAVGYDIVADIHGNTRSFFLSLLSGKKTLKYKDNNIKRLFLVEFGINFYKNAEPVYKKYINAMKKLVVSDDEQGTEIFIGGKRIERNPIAEFVGMCPVAVWETKRWPAERYAQLGKKIVAETGRNILIFGGKNDFRYCEDIKNAIGTHAKNLCGRSMKETAKVVAECSLLITNDTGMMHIAEAVKVPVVALFGPTSEEFGFYPLLKESIIISKKFGCKPCSTKGSRKCPVGDFKCMRSISVEEVFSACDSHL